MNEKNTNTILPLTEKYSPKLFVDIIGHSKAVKEIQEHIKNGTLPHLAIFGNAGVGKSSLAQVIANELYGKNKSRKVLEINASDDNGINVIRTTVKDFARYGGNNKLDKKSGEVPFKILILEESDSITDQAQAALRRTMEKYVKNCRFILLGNHKHKIIPPILSRCSVYDFPDITPEEMIPRLYYICENEKIDFTDKALKLVSERSNGDIRTAINSYLEKFRFYDGEINVKMISNDYGSVIDKIVRMSLNGDFIKGRNHFYEALHSGINIRQCIKLINNFSVSHNKFPDEMKGEISLICLESDFSKLKGCADDIVLTSMLYKLQLIGDKY